MKLFALDLGDHWIGTAISDSIGLLAKPYKTIKADELYSFLTTLLIQEPVDTVVIGYPITMQAKQSQQTQRVLQVKDELEKRFPTISWVLWDERLSSKRAQTLKKAVSKPEKIKAHSIAAAFILESYLTYKRTAFFEKNS